MNINLNFTMDIDIFQSITLRVATLFSQEVTHCPIGKSWKYEVQLDTLSAQFERQPVNVNDGIDKRSFILEVECVLLAIYRD